MPDNASKAGRAELIRVWGGVVVLAIVGFAAAWHFVKPGPPLHIRLATGSHSGAYYRFGERYRELLAQHGLTVEVVETAGSIDNLGRLARGEVDAAFVQGGVVGAAEATDSARLVGVASLYFEPLWIFLRDGLAATRLADLRGARISVGATGSGTRPIALELLRRNGIDADDATLLDLQGDEAADRLLRGDLDAMLMVAAPTAELLVRLMAADGGAIHLLDLTRAPAYERLYRFLRAVTVPAGLFDLAADRPARDVHLVAPLATLVASDALHPAILPQLIEAARVVHGGGGVFEQEGEFPSPRHLDFPIAPAADRHFRAGPSFLYRWLPFRVAAMLDRLKILLLPLLTLLLPLLKIAPPIYRWRIRSKIFRWYRVLRQIEQRTSGAHARDEVLAELARIEQEIVEVSVPPSYMEELYNLRLHMSWVRREVIDRASTGGMPEP